MPDLDVPDIDVPDAPSITPDKDLELFDSSSAAVPQSDVDIYNKHFSWPPEDPDDWVMSPTVIGFGWNLDHDPDRADYIHRYGARFISEVSLWNHDSWHTVEDLPPEMEDAYVTDINGNVVYSQEMVYLNLMHPAYRQLLRDHISIELDHGADGFVIDEISGAADAIYMGAGLDDYHVANFGNYLKTIYSDDKLASQGIDSLDGFNYREFLAAEGLMERYGRGEFRDIPFGQDYYQYLFEETQTFIIELIDFARNYAAEKGREIVITANFNPIYDSSLSVVDEALDYFTFEHGFYYDDWRLEESFASITTGYPIAPAIRYVNSQDKDAVVLLVIPDYGKLAKIGEPTATSLVLHAFARTYANLGYFCYFDLDYGFIGNKYAADHVRLRPYYAFLREHPDLFNDLISKSQVAVVIPPHLSAEDLGPVDGTQGVAWILDEINMDYAVIDFTQQIIDYELLIVQGYAWSDTEVVKLLEYIRSGGNVIAIDERFASRDENHLEVNRPELVSLRTDGTHQIGDGNFTFFSDYLGWKYYAMLDENAFERIADTVEEFITPNSAPDGVQVIPYYRNQDIVVHCLNQNYNGTDFTRLNQVSITVTLPDNFNVPGETLTVLSPDDSMVQEIPFVQDGNTLSFSLPSLYIWSTVAS
ncbi:hypothetical protein ACFLWK_01945 [Chloroflexota bacterium]